VFGLGRGKQEPGWLAVGIEADAIRIAQVIPSAIGKPLAGRWGLLRSPAPSKDHSLDKITRDEGLQHFQCTTLLGPSEYQILMVDAPSVPRDELRAAIRWRIKDLLEYHADDATVDVLEIPADPGAGGAKPRSMYAIAAPNELVQKRIEAFDAAHLSLKVIDIPEMAQRNVASHFEQPERTTAMVSFRDWGGLLTFSYGGELLLSRRLEVTWDQLALAEHRNHYFERVTTELQRSFEHLERQFHRFPVGELLLAPLPEPTGLAEHLAANLYVPVRAFSLAEVIEFPPDVMAKDAEQWEFFHLFGAAMRVEPKTL
jgi:MSHA biogenesis protein MshI